VSKRFSVGVIYLIYIKFNVDIDKFKYLILNTFV